MQHDISSLSDSREIGCKMTWPVRISPLSIDNGTTIGLKCVNWVSRAFAFRRKLAKSDLAQLIFRFDSLSPTGC